MRKAVTGDSGKNEGGRLILRCQIWMCIAREVCATAKVQTLDISSREPLQPTTYMYLNDSSVLHHRPLLSATGQ
jgi:hypothetical protein